MESSPLIEIDGVSHCFDGEPVLAEIDWTIKPGQHWGIIGPSGAGKTTLVKIASGYLWPNRGGTVRREGKEFRDLSEWRQTIGWLSTDLKERIPGHQSVKNTILAGALAQTRLAERPHLKLTENHHQQAETLLESIGLVSQKHQPFRSLSQGETQLILIARALIGNPVLLVMDEPCAGLDPGIREAFLSLLEDILARDPTISTLYISHHVEEFTSLTSHLLALKKGRIQARGTIDQVLTAQLLSELFEFPCEIIQREGRYWPVSDSDSSASSSA